MATVRWIGTRAVRRQLITITVSAAVNGTVYSIVHTSGATVTYTGTASDTTTTIATALVALMLAYGDVFSELEIASSAAVITAYGPADGATFGLTASTTPGTSMSGTTTTTAQSPHDAADTANYSGGALPSASDTLVFENSAVGVKYGLTALAAIALTAVIRKQTFTGQWGLPDIANGYTEFRTKTFSLNTATLTAEASVADSPGQFRILMVSGSATAININGSGNPSGTLGAEPWEINGTVSTSTLSVVGSGVWIATSLGSTAVFSSISIYNGALRAGETATLTTVRLTQSNADIGCAATTLTVDRGGTTRLYGTGAYTTVNVEEGILYYQSSGTITTANVGSGGILNSELAASAFTVTTLNLRGDGCEVKDPTRRINLGCNVVLTGTDLSRTKLDFGTGGTFAFSA